MFNIPQVTGVIVNWQLDLVGVDGTDRKVREVSIVDVFTVFSI